MSTDKRVVFAFVRGGEWADAAQFAVGIELVASARQDLVSVSLMTYVPDNAVFGRIVNIVESYC